MLLKINHPQRLLLSLKTHPHEIRSPPPPLKLLYPKLAVKSSLECSNPSPKIKFPEFAAKLSLTCSDWASDSEKKTTANNVFEHVGRLVKGALGSMTVAAALLLITVSGSNRAALAVPVTSSATVSSAVSERRAYSKHSTVNDWDAFKICVIIGLQTLTFSIYYYFCFNTRILLQVAIVDNEKKFARFLDTFQPPFLRSLVPGVVSYLLENFNDCVAGYSFVRYNKYREPYKQWCRKEELKLGRKISKLESKRRQSLESQKVDEASNYYTVFTFQLSYRLFHKLPRIKSKADLEEALITLDSKQDLIEGVYAYAYGLEYSPSSEQDLWKVLSSN